MGYPAPNQIPLKEDVTFRGICVYVPNEPEYIRALMGSLSGLATWGVWERDSDQSGSKSAELWKLANAVTFANIINECGGATVFDCEEMKDCLIEVAKAIDLNVTVNNYISSGGDGSSLYCVNDNGDIVVNPPPVTDTPTDPVVTLPPEIPVDPVDPTDPAPPDNWDTWGEYDTDACMVANSAVDWAERATRQFAEFLTFDVFIVTAIFALIVNFFTGGWALVFSSAMMLKLAEVFYRLWDNTEDVAGLFGDLNQEIIDNRQELVCMLYEARHDSANWTNLLIAWMLNRSVGSLNSTTNEPLWETALNYIFPQKMFLGQLYGSFTYKYDIANALDCSVCDTPVNDGSWSYSATGGSSVVDVENYFATIAIQGSVYKAGSFSAGSVSANLPIVAGTILDTEPIIMTAYDHSELSNEGSDTFTIRFYRDSGITLAEFNVTEGETELIVPSPNLIRGVSINRSWWYASTNFPMDCDFRVSLQIPVAE